MIHNSSGMVLDITKSYQLEPGESEDLCGPWSVSSLMFSGPPGKGARGDAEAIDRYADRWADHWLSGGHTGAQGSSIPDMHTFLTAAVEDFGPHPGGHRLLHFQDIPSDVGHIRAAVRAGYPVLFTANEANIVSKKTGARPYPWHIDANHVLPVAGIDKDGDFICPDELNNSFQGEWPCTYLAGRLNPSWACVVQVVGPDPTHPWLAPIPGPDPLKWPTGFNAQLFAIAGGGTTPPQKGTPLMTGLPTAAHDDGATKDTITFKNGHVMKAGFRKKYLELAAAGRIPPDDEALENEHQVTAPELSNPPFWPHGGSVQTTRYFRFAYSTDHGVVVTYIGQELLWYMAQAADLATQIAALRKQIANGPVVGTLPPAIEADIKIMVAAFDQLRKDAKV